MKAKSGRILKRIKHAILDQIKYIDNDHHCVCCSNLLWFCKKVTLLFEYYTMCRTDKDHI